jgi:hypothetical protein
MTAVAATDLPADVRCLADGAYSTTDTGRLVRCVGPHPTRVAGNGVALLGFEDAVDERVIWRSPLAPFVLNLRYQAQGKPATPEELAPWL